MNALDVRIEERAGAWVLVLIGSATAANVDVLGRAVTRISAARPARVVVDLSGLVFVSSLPIGELVGMARGVKMHGGTVVVAGANPMVREVMNHVRLGEVMPMVDSVDAALALGAG